MKIAIMQPYFLPYLGYWQLMDFVDKFIIYDDVNFINKGWINRNNILFNNEPHTFTIPLNKASQNKKILEITISEDQKWRNKLLKTFIHAYKKAPYFQNIFPIFEQIILNEDKNLSSFLKSSIQAIANYIGITTEIIPSSSKYDNAHLKGQERIISICREEDATHYINPIGGKELYDPSLFMQNNLELSFLKSFDFDYPQFQIDKFVPYLSIIDLLMFLEKSEVQNGLGKFKLE